MAARLSHEKVVCLPKVILERAGDDHRDISGVSFDEFQMRFPRIRFRVLNKINSTLSNKKLYEKGYLKNYVEGYLSHSLSKKFEALALPN